MIEEETGLRFEVRLSHPIGSGWHVFDTQAEGKNGLVSQHGDKQDAIVKCKERNASDALAGLTKWEKGDK